MQVLKDVQIHRCSQGSLGSCPTSYKSTISQKTLLEALYRQPQKVQLGFSDQA